MTHRSACCHHVAQSLWFACACGMMLHGHVLSCFRRLVPPVTRDDHVTTCTTVCTTGFSLETLSVVPYYLGTPWTPRSSPEGFSPEPLHLLDYRTPWKPASSPEAFPLETISVSQFSCSIIGAPMDFRIQPRRFSFETLSVNQFSCSIVRAPWTPESSPEGRLI